MSNSLFILVLFGAPGSGKGTISQYLKDKYDVLHFSTGNLLRNEVKIDTDIGRRVKDILGAGGLVSDDIVNEIVEKNIVNVVSQNKIVILDGYPRTVGQAKALDGMMLGEIHDTVHVIELDIDYEVVIKRISSRCVCANCGNTYGTQDNLTLCTCGGKLVKRKDDEKSSIRNRLLQYEKETLPVALYFADRLVKVSGDGQPDEVTRRIDKVLHSFGIEKRR